MCTYIVPYIICGVKITHTAAADPCTFILMPTDCYCNIPC